MRMMQQVSQQRWKMLVILLATLVAQAVPLAVSGTWSLFTTSSGNPSNLFSTVSLAAPVATGASSQPAGAVQVTWNAVSNSSSHASQYLVFRSPSGLGTYTQVTASAVSTLSYTDTPAADGLYDYVVETYVNGFASGYSNVVTGRSDRVAPTATIQCNSGSCAGPFASAVSVTISAIDSGSGVASITRNVDGTVTTTSGASVTFSVSAGASHTITYYATDNAGNAGTSQSVTFTIVQVTGWAVCDTNGSAPPVTPDWLKQTGSYRVYANVSGATSVTANVGKVGSAPFASAIALSSGSYTCAGTTYGYASASQTAPNTLVAGANTVYAEIVAVNGSATNDSNSGRTGDVSVDTVAPTSPTASYVSGPSTGQITFNWTSSTDASSGVAGYSITILDGSTLLPPPGYPNPVVVGAGVNRYLFSGLVSGNSYDIVIVASDNAGNNTAMVWVVATAK